MAAVKASAASKSVKESGKSGKKEKVVAVEVKEASVSPVRTGRRSVAAAAVVAPASPSARRSSSPAPLKTKKKTAVKKVKEQVKEEAVEQEAEVVKATPLIKKKSVVAPVSSSAAHCSDSKSCGSCAQKFTNGYLFLYNAASAVAWAYLMFSLGRSFFFDEPQNTRVLFGKTGMYLAYLQTVALLEVLHAALGLVRSGVMSNVIQISSRLFVIWVAAVMGETGKHWAYAMMATAWSISDFTRYAYYLTQLTKVPSPCLKWARYNFFLVLYPVGTLGEAILIYLARLNKFSADPILNFGLLAVLAIYTPGNTHFIFYFCVIICFFVLFRFLVHVLAYAPTAC